MGKNLEEIFWQDGKFFDEKGKEVNAKPIDIPRIIKGEYKKDLKYFIKSFCACTKGENSFMRGEENNLRVEGYKRYVFDIAIQFYKI